MSWRSERRETSRWENTVENLRPKGRIRNSSGLDIDQFAEDHPEGDPMHRDPNRPTKIRRLRRTTETHRTSR